MRAALVIAALLLVSVPAPAQAWGFEAHRFIMDRAIALLPAELRPLFEANRAMVVERAVDPDTWRIAGFGEENPHHFLDIDSDGYGPYPFAGLPRSYDQAVAKFGVDRVTQNGTLPWRTEEVFGNLRRQFEQYQRGDQYGFGRFNVLFQAAVLAHYTSDAHVPLHAVVNYTGQLTGQNGLHQRWEDTLFERYRDRFTIAPKSVAPIANPRDFIFDRILEDTRLVPGLLKADLDAVGNGDTYDDAYYEAFFKAQGSVIAGRLNDSIAAVAAMITGAWEAAGKPPVPAQSPRTPQRRRRP
jgi:hypothetical protein